MDSFFASVEQQARPELRGKPIAVSGDPKSRTVVAAASKEAKRYGVKSAMTIHEARARCPGIQFVLGDPDKYVEVSRRVMSVFGAYTPDVEVASIDEAFLDVTGWCERYVCTVEKTFTGPVTDHPLRAPAVRAEGDPRSVSPAHAASCGAVHLAHGLKRRVAAAMGKYITCSIGIAPNKRLAKLGSDFRKPDGIVLVHAGEPPNVHGRATVISRVDLLASLNLRDLCGIGLRIEARLARLGITTVGQLAAVPSDLLVAEFGSYGYELHDMAIGHDVAVVDAEDADPKSMGHAATLPHDVHGTAGVRPVVEELAEKVAARLRRQGFLGATVQVTLRFRDFSSRSEQTTFPDATDDGLRIRDAGMNMIAAWMLPKPIRLVGVSASNLRRAASLQESLFLRDRRWRAATAALDAVNDRYGDHTVVRASLLGGMRYLRKVAAAFRNTSHLKGR